MPAADIISRAEVDSLINFIQNKESQFGESLKRTLDGPSTLMTASLTSARIGGDIYRTVDRTGIWQQAAAANALMASVLVSDQALGENEDVVLASPVIEITSGAAPSNVPATTSSVAARAAQEFLYVHVNMTNFAENNKVFLKGPSYKYLEEDLAIMMAIRPSTNGPWSVHALPGDVRLYESRALIGVNAWGLLELLPSNRGAAIQLFLAGWGSQ